MRPLMVSALLGLGVLGFTATNEAKASWLSETLNNSQVQLNIGPAYPAYSPAVYAPVVAPVQVYRPVAVCAPPVYTPAPVVPVYRPVPVNVPQNSYYGPNYGPNYGRNYGPSYGSNYGSNYGPNYGPNRFDHHTNDWRR